MKTAILIPLHNGVSHIGACIQALLTQIGASDQILVVENGSTDRSAELVAHDFPSIELIRAVQALGFAGAVNQGIRTLLSKARSPDVIVVLNQDTIVDPHWLHKLLQPLQEDERIGIVGSLARYPTGEIQHAGGEILRPLGYGRNIAAGEAVLPVEVPPIDYIAAIAAAYRVTMLQAIGLFDEGFNPAYFEDVDLSFRAIAGGWKLHLAAGATLIHAEGALSRSDYSHAALIERNRLRFVLKHFTPNDIVGGFAEAERVQLRERANQGMSQVLRQAYLSALIALPQIARTRFWEQALQTQIGALLGELRTTATSIERTTRMAGLQLPLPRRFERSEQHVVTPVLQAQRHNFVAGKRPPVSIIMLTWNGLDVTKECLESLWSHTRDVDYHLVIVDNGSTDGTREWLRGLSNITLIENATNEGFTRGNNIGLATVPADHDVLLLNNDTILIQDDWLAHLREVANEHVDYGVVGCTLLRRDGALQHAGTYLPTDTFWGYQIGGGEAYIGQYPGIREVEGVVGACMYIRRDVRAAIGGLDEDFFSYYEDTDYCLRARAAGYKVVCTGAVQVVHLENTSTKLNNANWQRMFNTAQVTFLRKWRHHYANQYTRRLLWHSLVAGPTGYATSSREFVLELDRRHVDIRLACIFGTDYTEPPTKDPRIDQLRSRPKDASIPQVVYSQGDAFIKNSGRYRIGFTMLEADGLPSDWVTQANAMDEVWTPTEWGADVFHASGIRRPIHVIPLGYDPNYFHPKIACRRPSSRFVFLSVFDWIERKAPEVLLRAYLEEFTAADDVLLLLKVFNHDPYFDIQRYVRELIRSKNAPTISLLLNHSVAPHQMGSIYRSADCFVLPTRGEGWGMPILEAMACGLPVIATDWGAQRDFFTADVGYPIQIRRLIPAVARSPYYAGLRWADPDREHLRHLMRYVYEHPEEARQIGAKAATDVATKWTWTHATDRIMERLEDIQA